jgi:aryl-alcohol dehydrogenase-like predicted oxidoreductase
LAAIQLARERGITWFDTAPTYGDGASERLLGRALKPHRDSVKLATKVGPRDDARRSLEDSLRRLDTEYVDLVQVHEIGERWEWRLEELHRLQEEGKAQAIGLCNATHVELARAITLAPLLSYQGPYNLFDRDVEERLLPLCREQGLAFLAYRPLAAGLLCGGYDAPPQFGGGDHRAQLYWFRGAEFERRRRVIDRLREIAPAAGVSPAVIALRWLLSRTGVTVILVGARSRNHVTENLAALEAPLSDADLGEIEEVVHDAFRLPTATSAATRQAATWGPRERFIVERLGGRATPESIAAAWTDRGEQPMVAAQVKVFADQLCEQGLAGMP